MSKDNAETRKLGPECDFLSTLLSVDKEEGQSKKRLETMGCKSDEISEIDGKPSTECPEESSSGGNDSTTQNNKPLQSPSENIIKAESSDTANKPDNSEADKKSENDVLSFDDISIPEELSDAEPTDKSQAPDISTSTPSNDAKEQEDRTQVTEEKANSDTDSNEKDAEKISPTSAKCTSTERDTSEDATDLSDLCLEEAKSEEQNDDSKKVGDANDIVETNIESKPDSPPGIPTERETESSEVNTENEVSQLSEIPLADKECALDADSSQKDTSSDSPTSKENETCSEDKENANSDKAECETKSSTNNSSSQSQNQDSDKSCSDEKNLNHRTEKEKDSCIEKSDNLDDTKSVQSSEIIIIKDSDSNSVDNSVQTLTSKEVNLERRTSREEEYYSVVTGERIISSFLTLKLSICNIFTICALYTVIM